MRLKLHAKRQRNNCDISSMLSRSTSKLQRESKTKLFSVKTHLKTQRMKMKTTTAELSELWLSKRPASRHVYWKITKLPLELFPKYSRECPSRRSAIHMRLLFQVVIIAVCRSAIVRVLSIGTAVARKGGPPIGYVYRM
jgi:hypothetical protein